MEVKKPSSSNDFTARKNSTGGITVFLAGSIENGKAENWQDKFVKNFEDLNITFLNPRRVNWDSSWEQSVKNPEFAYQVGWELSGLQMSDYIVLYFDPTTKSPISLLELGLYAHDPKLYVCCPDGFYRQGNVEFTCHFYDVPFYRSYNDFIVHMRIIWEEKLKL